MDRDTTSAWPELRADAWAPTREHLHLMTQVLGKLRLAQEPLVNHWWHVTLQVSECGLTTGAVRWAEEHFEVELDLVRARLRASTSRGEGRELPLGAGSLAGFHRGLMDALAALGVPVAITTAPQEMEHEVPFDRDEAPRPFDADAARRFHCALRQADRLLRDFRGRFLGKSSPVHFFWGSFDLAVTRFSGRRAPERPGADAVTREAYSHEVCSAGFWPGGGDHDALFYCYASPEPEGFERAPAGPPGAAYDQDLGQFVLPYDTVRAAPDPDAAVLLFLQATYEAAADLAGWDRAALERAG